MSWTRRIALTVLCTVAMLGCTAAEADTLDDVRYCESRNSYWIVDASGTYHGAYQFDLQTWQSVGGQGAPELAAPEEQDYRAWILYTERGCEPWPNCCFD